MNGKFRLLNLKIFLKNDMKLPCFLIKLRGSWKGTWSCLMFSKRFLVLPMELLLFLHSCQIVIYLCFAGKALINSLFFSKFSSDSLNKKYRRHQYFCRVGSNSFLSYLSISWITIKKLAWIWSNRHAQSLPKNVMRCINTMYTLRFFCALFGKQVLRFRKMVTVVSVPNARPFEIESFFFMKMPIT